MLLSQISQALQLDEDEQKHLFNLANLDPVRHHIAPKPEQPDTVLLQNLADQLRYPSFIANEVADVIIWNRGAELVIADFGNLSANERNMGLAGEIKHKHGVQAYALPNDLSKGGAPR